MPWHIEDHSSLEISRNTEEDGATVRELVIILSSVTAVKYFWRKDLNIKACNEIVFACKG